VDTALSQHLSRLSKMLLAGLGVAFAWVLLSLALGLSSSQAHADDGLLGGLGSTVEDTTSAVTAVVDDTATAVIAPVVEPVAAVTEPVAPVVERVAQTAPVSPVVEAVQTVAAPVANAVDAAGESGVVAPIVDSAVTVIASVPVVGEVSSALGVDSAASSLGSSVDDVLQSTTGTVEQTVITPVVAPVAGALTDVIDTATGVVPTPVSPVIPPEGVFDGVSHSIVGTVLPDAAPGVIETLSRAAFLAGASAWLAMLEMPSALLTGDGSGVTDAGAGILFTLLRSGIQADSVFVGSGGAGPGAWVLVALGFVVAHRAWVRRTGLENDVAPPAPALSTDVSPD
jgi:hypothetical protein